MRVIVCGSRKWIDRRRVEYRLADLPGDTTIVVGYNPKKDTPEGADRFAYQEAQKLGLTVELARKIKRNPMEFVPRTRRPDPDTLNLKTISSGEVAALFRAADTWPERLCIAVLAYLGPRRHAAATLRLSDYDELRGRLRFFEKGGKTIWKPIPGELDDLIDQARKAGAILPPPDDYLIPPEGPLSRDGNRDDRVIWRLVKKIAEKAGVDTHTHAIRAAFADFWLDSGGDGKALQLLMGHKSPTTTERYTRRYDRERRMAPVRDLSWNLLVSGQTTGSGENLANSGILVSGVSSMGAGGFEPPLGAIPHQQRAGTQSRLGFDVAGAFLR